jgi:hypothetical protein
LLLAMFRIAWSVFV